MSCDNNVVSLGTPQRGGNGVSSYTYIAYADNVVAGTPDTITNISYNTPTVGSQWFAFITSPTVITSFTPTLFEDKWVKFKGADGAGAAGISIKNNNTLIKANVNILDFVGAGLTGVTVTDPGSTEVDISIVTAGLISKTRSQMLLDITNNLVVPGANYLITDAVGSIGGGVILKGITTNKITTEGNFIGYFPDYQNASGDFVDVWSSLDSSVTTGSLYSYGWIMYESLTGVTGIVPPADATNWLPISTNDTRYQTEILNVCYDIVGDVIFYGLDTRGNLVIGPDFYFFKWGQTTTNSNVIYTAGGGSSIYTTNRSIFRNNLLHAVSFAPSYSLSSFTNNNLNNTTISVGNDLGGSVEITNCIGTSPALQISNTATSGTMTVNKCIFNSTTSVVINGSSNQINNTLFNNFDLIGTTVNTSTFSLNSSNISLPVTLTANTTNITVNPTYSNHQVNVDLDTAMSGNTLTEQSYMKGAGKWICTAATTKTIDKIVSGSGILHPVEITSADTKSTIVLPTAIASAVDNNIVSDAGSVTLVGRTAGSDFYIIQREGNIWKKLSSVKYI